MPERHALGNFYHHGGKATVIRQHPPRDAVDRRLVGDLQLAAKRVAEQMLAESAYEFLGPREDGVLELLNVLELRLAEKLATRVDGVVLIRKQQFLTSPPNH